jgi:alpha-D-xyloside xylohydrolase
MRPLVMDFTNDKQTLNIGDRRGEFPGMLKDRTFDVVFVNGGHGHGSGVADADAIDRIVKYSGQSISVTAQK